MNPYNRMARTVVYLVASGFIVVSALDIAVYWLKTSRDHTGMSAAHCLYLSIPLVIGIAILVKSPALARWLNQYLDDEE